MVLAERFLVGQRDLWKILPPALPSKMRLLYIVGLVCLLGLASAQGDLCAFPVVEGYSVWIASHAQIHSIPFDSTRRNTLVHILNSTWNAYSFHDYLSEPIAPYNMQVRPSEFSLFRPLWASVRVFCASLALIAIFFIS